MRTQPSGSLKRANHLTFLIFSDGLQISFVEDDNLCQNADVVFENETAVLYFDSKGDCDVTTMKARLHRIKKEVLLFINTLASKVDLFSQSFQKTLSCSFRGRARRTEYCKQRQLSGKLACVTSSKPRPRHFFPV